MKLAVLLLFISVSALAQQKDKPVKHIDRIDSLDLDFDWKKEVFKMWDCYCPWLRADSVQSMPREFSPYQWKDEGKPIVIKLDSAQWGYFRKFLRVDSSQLKKKKQTVL